MPLLLEMVVGWSIAIALVIVALLLALARLLTWIMWPLFYLLDTPLFSYSLGISFLAINGLILWAAWSEPWTRDCQGLALVWMLTGYIVLVCTRVCQLSQEEVKIQTVVELAA